MATDPPKFPDGVSEASIRDTLKLIEMMERHRQFNKMLYFKPITQQRKFIALTSTCREVLFMAANRVGKSDTGADVAACHLTGDYPPDWQGKKFTHPTKGWIAGTTSLDVRNVCQTKLCGQYGVTRAFGTGFIPRDRFADKPTLARGVTDAFDTIQVIHKTNGVEDGVSIASFKSYEQGRTKFQGETLDWGWADEEPPSRASDDVYSEFLTRIKGDGSMFITFTPMDGETPLTDRFLKSKSQDRGVVFLDLMDPEVVWWSDEEKRKMVEAYPAWQRKARVHGVPLLGSGAVFPYDEEQIKETPLTFIPAHWVLLWGIDFGVAHPFAAVLIAWDRDADVIHVYKCIRMAAPEGTILQPNNHARAMQAICRQAPVAWPHDGTQREKGSGIPLSSVYKAEGLKMLEEHATFEKGGYSTEAGITEMGQRMATNRLKVGADCFEWFEEFRSYHRKDGLIEKVRDDLMSATRQAVMAKRFARAVPLGDFKPSTSSRAQYAIGSDPFAWGAGVDEQAWGA